MKLYRAFSKDSRDDGAVFYDATASFRDCVEFASRLKLRQPLSDIWVDEENWSSLTPARYYWHRATGSHEGFGIAFQSKHDIRISGSRVVWPEAAVLKWRAEEFVVGIEPASDFVLVASPKYDGKYRCEVVVRSSFALVQAKELRDSTFGGDPEDVLMRNALPIWLERTQRDARSPVIMPLPFFKLLDPWVGNFIERGEATVFCLDCNQTVTDIQTDTRNQHSSGNRGEWTSSWRCPSGHNLYAEDHDVRLIMRPR